MKAVVTGRLRTTLPRMYIPKKVPGYTPICTAKKATSGMLTIGTIGQDESGHRIVWSRNGGKWWSGFWSINLDESAFNV